MTASARRVLVALAVAATISGACGGDKDDAPKAQDEPTTTEAPVPAAPGTGAPLTGLAADPAKLARPALIVKIDNAPKGRPQAGINEADIVVEEGVEGGITRFAAVFHSRDVAEVGPVRSARSTDIAIASELNRPLFAYSGANAAFQQLVDKAPLVNVGQNARPGAYFRKKGRPSTYDLWARMGELFAAAPQGAAPPPPLFPYRAEGEASAGQPAAGVKFEFRDKVVTAVEWRWDSGAGVWRRKQNGTDHVDDGGTPVGPRNIVIQFVDYKNTGQVDRSGTQVPEAQLVGEGEAWVFVDGKVVKGKWTKTGAADATKFVDPGGAPIKLTPGQTWLELPKPGTATLL